MADKEEQGFADMVDNPETISRVVRELARREAERLHFSGTEEYKDRLRAAYELFLVRHEFRPGQFVRWKTGLKNRTYPDESSVGIVMEMLAEPAMPDKDSGSQYFREPLDLAVGILRGDGGEDLLTVYWFDSRRFEPAS